MGKQKANGTFHSQDSLFAFQEKYLWIVTGTDKDTEFLFKTGLGDLKYLVSGHVG